jgi:hypothetical protein
MKAYELMAFPRVTCRVTGMTRLFVRGCATFQSRKGFWNRESETTEEILAYGKHHCNRHRYELDDDQRDAVQRISRYEARQRSGVA